MRWRQLFVVALLYSGIEGFVANKLYPAKLPLLYRDLLLLGTYLVFMMQEPVGYWTTQLRQRIGGTAWMWAIGFLFVGLLQIFNPLLPNLMVGLLGFKVLYLYWPLALLAYAYTDNPDRAVRLLKWLVWWSVPINLFGLYQFQAGPEFLASLGPGFERSTQIAFYTGAGGEFPSFVRVISTFAASGQYTSYLLANAMMIFALLLTARTARGRIVWQAMALMNFIALLATGSRGGILSIGLMAIVMGMFCSSAQRTLRFAALAAVALYLGFQWMGLGVVKRFETLRDIDTLHQRTVGTTPVMFAELFKEAPLGVGLGIGSVQTRYVMEEEDLGQIRMIENHPSKLQLETGIFGVICFYAFVFLLGGRWIRHWCHPLNPALVDLVGPLSALCLTNLALSFLVGGFDSPSSAVFFWTLLGMVARLSSVPAGEGPT